jgi:hypothetical protein
MKHNTTQHKIDKFKALIQKGLKAWTEAGELLVEIVDADPNARAHLVAETGLKRCHLAQLEAVGRGGMEPRLLLNVSEGYAKLRTCSLSEQRDALENGIKVYESTIDGCDIHRVVRPESLNPFERSQVFGPGGYIRDLEEQKEYLTKRVRRKVTAAATTVVDLPDYVVDGGQVTINGVCTLTIAQISSILHEMTKGK